VSRPHKTISIIAGGLREYRHDSRSKRKWLFLNTLYSDYSQLKITELHFAIDIPYWIDELKVEPKRYTGKYKSTYYFDRRRTNDTTSTKRPITDDDIIIYDKSWKCGLSLPMTRIELRLRPEQINTIVSKGCIVENESLQEHLAAIITKKLRTLKIKKGRSTIRLEKCDKHIAISIAMQYLQGDDSLLSLLLVHRSESIILSSKLFNKYIRDSSLYQRRLNRTDDYNTKERIQLVQMQKHFRKYDINSKKHRNPLRRKRLSDEEIKILVEMSYQGMTMSEIGSKLGVSESTVSRILKRTGIRRVKLSGVVQMLW
jgi:DNA-binding CsgD family transcriptional regulator